MEIIRTSELLDAIYFYRQQGYSDQEQVEGLVKSRSRPDVAKIVREDLEKGFSPEYILRKIEKAEKIVLPYKYFFSISVILVFAGIGVLLFRNKTTRRGK